ncbi:MAG: D-alanyl-D-alanine carboxypeptidase [Defluviitaleaceae bacterium]|nr:D-alanyl-D-alanine carboxypeptidase [Defluviitaleaceae bacterium]
MNKKIFLVFAACLVLSLLTLDSAFAANIPAQPQISAPAAVLMDANSGVIIYSRNMNSANYPASITKIMTALLAIEMAEGDLDQRILFSHHAVSSIPRNTSNIAMNEGETLSLREALMALMLESANEVCNAVGEHFSITTEEFSRKMTERAIEIGAVNTNFTNTHGLHHANHYTTALDMAHIMREAITHPEFLEIISTSTFQIPPTERQPLPRDLNNTHRMIRPGHQFYNEYVVGGKTGFTNEARNTLVTYAEKDGIELIAVVLQNDGAQRSYEDTAALFTFGFDMFGQVMIFDANNFSEQISVMESRDGGSAEETAVIDIYARENVLMNLPLNLRDYDIRREVDIPVYLSPPVRRGEQVGSIRLMYLNSLLATVPLFAADYVEPVFSVMPTNSGLLPGEESGSGPIGLQTIITAVFAGVVALASFYVLMERGRRRRKRELKIKIRRDRIRQKRSDRYGVLKDRNFRYRDG